MARTIEIDQQITISHLAQELELPATNLIAQLFKNGLVLTLNEKIDFDTATILIDDLGLDVRVKQKLATPILASKSRDNAVNRERPPVVALMGHIDHGKTSLLDKIRGSDKVSQEAGGITQHISASQVKHQNRLITFLDTPGHEVFAAVREQGALLTDVVVLIVAADDGVKEQTIEALRFARKTGVKIIVAATKIDKEAADIHRLKQQLAQHNLLAEDMGGDTIIVPVSAKTGEGIDQLLDMILLVADIEKLQADCQGQAAGLIIETHMEQGLGAIAVVLVQEGVLQLGDFIVAGGAWGKVRLLKDSSQKVVEQAEASTPVSVCGFKSLPQFGINFQVVSSEKEAKKITDLFNQQTQIESSGVSKKELLRLIEQRTTVNQCKVIIKADAMGSLQAILDSLKVLDTNEVATCIVDSGVGSVNENDINTARISQATIYGFNLNIPANIRRQAGQAGVNLKLYDVIYELLDDIKDTLEGLLAPEVIEQELGSLVVKGVFKTSRSELICGGSLESGKLSLPAMARIKRGKKTLAEAEVVSLAKGQKEVAEIVAPSMCGIRLSTTHKVTLKIEDILDFYRLSKKVRKL